MKTQLLLLALITSLFVTQMEGQNRTIVNANNSEISDNLDLRVVASIFGDSNNLQEFERRLNDPKLQISNLDLNYDNKVDYLRVIESVENRIHVVIIQSVLDRDLYQDVVTIEVEKDRHNEVHIQVVGNTYMYGQNYIYEPVYYSTPLIYASFWMSNYRPYYSSWSWNYYPSFYYSWNPYPVFRYRYNVNNCLNTYYSYNNYNYVNYRRSTDAVKIYNSRRSNGYERQNPNYSFERRNSNVANRYELDQKRNSRNGDLRNEVGYSKNRFESSTLETQRANSQNSSESPRVVSQQRTSPQSDYAQNRSESPRVATQQRTSSQSDYAQNRKESSVVSVQQRTDFQRDYSPNRNETTRASSQQRTEPQRDYSQNRSASPRTSAPQNTPSRNDNSSSRNSSSRDNNSSKNNNRRS